MDKRKFIFVLQFQNPLQMFGHPKMSKFTYSLNPHLLTIHY